MRRKGKRNRQKEDLKSWRRNYIIMQTSKGRTQRDIASLLKVGVGTVNRDLSWFRDKTKEEITNFIEKVLEEHEKSMVGLNAVLKEAWFIIENSSDSKEKLTALSLVKECYALREDLICNLPIIDEALKLDSKEGRVEETEGQQPCVERNKLRGAADPENLCEEQGRGIDVFGVEGEKKGKDEIQGTEEKTREDQKRKTTNRTF